MVAGESKEEENVHGSVGWRIYFEYMKAGKGYIYLTLYLLLSVTFQVFNMFAWHY